MGDLVGVFLVLSVATQSDTVGRGEKVTFRDSVAFGAIAFFDGEPSSCSGDVVSALSNDIDDAGLISSLIVPDAVEHKEGTPSDDSVSRFGDRYVLYSTTPVVVSLRAGDP